MNVFLDHMKDFVIKKFSNLTSLTFDKDPNQMAAKMMSWEYGSADNFTKENIHFTNDGTSTIRMLGVFKNIDYKNKCANFYISNYYGAFNIAKDLISW